MDCSIIKARASRKFTAISTMLFALCLTMIIATPGAAFADGQTLTAGSLLSKQAASIDELEPNNSMIDAHSIPFGSKVYGNVTNTDGDDYFKLVAPENGTLEVTLKSRTFIRGYVTLYIYDGNGESLTYRQNYTNQAISTITLTRGVTYNKAYYLRVHKGTGDEVPYTLSPSYQIQPTTQKKLIAGKRKFTAQWEKKANATSYQLRITTKDDYSRYKWAKADTANIDINKLTFVQLKKKTQYRCQVRVLRVIGGVTYYSPWSNTQKVKTK